jgi:hypothetical protein
MLLRTCKKCKQDLPFSEFKANNTSRDGLARSCTPCISASRTAVQARKKPNQVPSRDTLEERRQRHNASVRAYYQRSKEAINFQREDYRFRNKGKVNAIAASCRTRKKGQAPELTESQKQWMENIYKRAALLTKLTGTPYHVDHWWPVSKGGLHVPWNLYVVPATTNREKHATVPVGNVYRLG